MKRRVACWGHNFYCIHRVVAGRGGFAAGLVAVAFLAVVAGLLPLGPRLIAPGRFLRDEYRFPIALDYTGHWSCEISLGENLADFGTTNKPTVFCDAAIIG